MASMTRTSVTTGPEQLFDEQRVTQLVRTIEAINDSAAA
jgi:hypothetical protein